MRIGMLIVAVITGSLLTRWYDRSVTPRRIVNRLFARGDR